MVRGTKIPAILMLAPLGLTVRTAVGLLSGSTFAYFIQQIATTVTLAALFLGSVAIGRPVIARLSPTTSVRSRPTWRTARRSCACSAD